LEIKKGEKFEQKIKNLHHYSTVSVCPINDLFFNQNFLRRKIMQEKSVEIINAIKIIERNGGIVKIIPARAYENPEKRIVFHPFPGLKILGALDCLINRGNFFRVRRASDLGFYLKQN
jgi:hypothetical protein